MWSHDERKEVSDVYIAMATVRCPKCGAISKKYVKSWYTGGIPCVLLAKQCKYCGSSLSNKN